MARIYVSGHNDEALTTTTKNLISDTDPDGDGRILWIEDIYLYNSHATEVGVVLLYDQDEGSATAANQRGATLSVPALDTLHVHYESPLPFVTNFGVTATAGTFATLAQGASGYLA
jgi:hypothetical protein